MNTMTEKISKLSSSLKELVAHNRRKAAISALSLACVAGLTATLIVMSEEKTPTEVETQLSPGTIIPHEPFHTQIKHPRSGRMEAATVIRQNGRGYNTFVVRFASTGETELQITEKKCKDFQKIVEHFPKPYSPGYAVPLAMTLQIHDPLKKENPATKSGLVLTPRPHGFIFEENKTKIRESIAMHAIPVKDRIQITTVFNFEKLSSEKIKEIAESYDARLKAQIKAKMTPAEHSAAYEAEIAGLLEAHKTIGNAAQEESLAFQKQGTFRTMKEAITALQNPGLFPNTHRYEDLNNDLAQKRGPQNQYVPNYDKSVETILWWDHIQNMNPKNPQEDEIVSLRPTFEKMGIVPIVQTPKGCTLYSGFYLANYLIQKDGGKPITFAAYENAAVKATVVALGHKPNPKTDAFTNSAVTGAIKLLHGKELKAMRIPSIVGFPQPLSQEIIKHFLRNKIPVPATIWSTLGGHTILITGFRQEGGSCTYEYIDTYGPNKFNGGYGERKNALPVGAFWFE